MKHKYTPEQVAFIVENVEGRSNKELTEMFNLEFDLNLKVTQIVGAKNNRGLSSGLSGRFEKGHETWNKGMKGIDFSGGKGWFVKGQAPVNYRPVGDERTGDDGYVYVKVADPSVWELKHRFLYEEVNGPIPDNHVILFGDGNKNNFDAENLLLVSRAQLAVMNKNDLIQDDAELTKVGVAISDLIMKMSERTRG